MLLVDQIVLGVIIVGLAIVLALTMVWDAMHPTNTENTTDAEGTSNSGSG